MVEILSRHVERLLGPGLETKIQEIQQQITATERLITDQEQTMDALKQSAGRAPFDQRLNIEIEYLATLRGHLSWLQDRLDRREKLLRLMRRG